MRSIFVIAGLMLVVISAGCGGDAQDQYPSSISVTGTGTAYGDAEIASIVFGVDLLRSDPGEAVDQAARMMDEAISALQEMGIQAEDMKTTSYSLWPEQQYDYNTYSYTGDTDYHVSHYIQVDVRDLDSVGDVLSALVGSGSNTIQSVTFRMENADSLMRIARTRAVDDAREKAQQIADQLGMELGEPTYVSEYQDYYPMSGVTSYCADAVGEIAAPSISPGAQSVTLSVQVTFQIK